LALQEVVVQTHGAVFELARPRRPAVQGVVDVLGPGPVVGNAPALKLQSFKHVVSHRLDHLSTPVKPLLMVETSELPFAW
jgi:hypothetical protein